jgi:hypothetical protein
MTSLRSFCLIAAVICAGIGLHAAGILPSESKASVPSSSIREAVAAETVNAAKWVATLATDGGAATGLTQVICFSDVNNTLQLQQMNGLGIEFVYKTCPTGTCVASPLKDFRPNQPAVTYTVNVDGGTDGTYAHLGGTMTTDPIEMGLDKCINAASADGGRMVLNLFQLTKNIVR